MRELAVWPSDIGDFGYQMLLDSMKFWGYLDMSVCCEQVSRDIRWRNRSGKGNYVSLKLYIYIYTYIKSYIQLTYGPHKAVAEVSNHNPIGRKSGIQLVRKSMDFTFGCLVLN